MTERLSALDASFLYLETANAPLHTGSVVLFQESPGALDHQRVVKLIQERIAFLPRYRQRLREVPGGLAHPVWVDDAHFDAAFEQIDMSSDPKIKPYRDMDSEYAYENRPSEGAPKFEATDDHKKL